MRTLTARERRIVAAGGGTVVVALIVTFGILPAVRAYTTARATLVAELDLLDREREAVQHSFATDAALRRAEHTLAALAHSVFDAAEPELATLEVARMVEAIAALSGVANARNTPLGIELAEHDVTHLRVRTAGETGFAQLALLLQRIEAAPMLLLVEQLSVRAADNRVSAATGEPMLAFAITIRAIGFADRRRLVSGENSQPAMPARTDGLSETALLAALIDDPFQPGLNVPGAVQDAETALPEFAGTAPRIAVLGTVVLPDRKGLVMARWGSDPPRLVRVGERVGGVRLIRVEPGAAEFEGDDGETFLVRVPKPGA